MIKKHTIKYKKKKIIWFRSLYWKFYWKFVEIISPKKLRSIYGPVFKANMKDATFRSYIEGEYGYSLFDLLKNMKRQFIFVDIGANQGLYTILAKQNSKCKHVYAFEPVKNTFKLLEENIELNHISPDVQSFSCAISDKSGNANVSVNPYHSGGSSLEHLSDSVPVETISKISHHEMNEILNVEDDVEIVVKIDTEGHEPVVINELRKCCFWDSISHLFFEVDDAWYSINTVIGLLENDGFVEAWRTPDQHAHYDILMSRMSR